MDITKLENINQTQQERLFHIDFKLRFLGSINRNDLVSRFGIKDAAATRDIALYKKIAPENLIYDTKKKSYLVSQIFKPVFEYSGNQALSALVTGLGDDHVANTNGLIRSESPVQLNPPNVDVLSIVSRAVHCKKAVEIEYRSIANGLSKRKIIPFALVDNGLRWHVRAYDKKREKFLDFVINRISSAEILNDEIKESETREADIQWNRIVEMHIVPHPRLKYPDTIEMEYAMNNEKMLKIQARAAVAGYVLRRWNVDCSKNHDLKNPEVHLWLKNRQTLYGVENLAIAPGYETGKDL